MTSISRTYTVKFRTLQNFLFPPRQALCSRCQSRFNAPVQHPLPSETVIRARAGIAEYLAQAAQALNRAHTLSREARLGDLTAYVQLDAHRYALNTNDALNPDLLQAIDAVAWRCLMQKSTLKPFFEGAPHSPHGPPLTLRTVSGAVDTAARTHQARMKALLNRATHHLSWDYRHNCAFPYRRTLVLHHLMRRYGEGANRYLHLHSRTTDALDELTVVLNWLNKPADVSPGPLWNALTDALIERRPVWHGPHFSIRWLLRGVGRLEFHHDRSVERLNAVLQARHRPSTSPPLIHPIQPPMLREH